jgi:hypothetical protein
MCEKQSTCDQCKKQEPSKNSAAQENNEKNGVFQYPYLHPSILFSRAAPSSVVYIVNVQRQCAVMHVPTPRLRRHSEPQTHHGRP